MIWSTHPTVLQIDAYQHEEKLKTHHPTLESKAQQPARKYYQLDKDLNSSHTKGVETVRVERFHHASHLCPFSPCSLFTIFFLFLHRRHPRYHNSRKLMQLGCQSNQTSAPTLKFSLLQCVPSSLERSKDSACSYKLLFKNY